MLGAWSGYVDLRARAPRERATCASSVRRAGDGARSSSRTALREADRLREIAGPASRSLPLDDRRAPRSWPGTACPGIRTVTLDRGRADGDRPRRARDQPDRAWWGAWWRWVRARPRCSSCWTARAGPGRRASSAAAWPGSSPARSGFADAGANDLVMKYVPVLADVVVGDVVVTSGLDRIYPKGLVVGRVRSVGAGRALQGDPGDAGRALRPDSKRSWWCPRKPTADPAADRPRSTKSVTR